jgi:hypothetical protein
MTTPPSAGGIVPYDFAEEAAQWAADAATQLAATVETTKPIIVKATADAVASIAHTPSVRQMEIDAFHAVVSNLLSELQNQPLWKKYSNTITAIISGLVVLAGWIVTTDIGLPHWFQIAAGVVMFIGSVLGIKSTKNGLTDSVLTSVLTAPGSPVAPSESAGRHSALS